MITKFKIFENLNITITSINDVIDFIDNGINYEKNKELLIDFIWDYSSKSFLADAIKLFLEDGADKIINYINVDYESALTSAAYFSKYDKSLKFGLSFGPIFETVKILIDYGADWSHMDDDGDDFIDLLETEKMKIEIKKLYPEKYRNYLKNKQAKKFKI